MGTFKRTGPGNLPPPPAPLLPMATAVIVGIIVARFTLITVPVFITAAVIAVIALPAVFYYYRCSTGRRCPYYPDIILLCVCFASIGGLRYYLVYNYYRPDHISGYCQPGQRRLATVRGVITTEPYISKSIGTFADFDYIHQPRTIFTVRCEEVLCDDGWCATSGLAQVGIDEPEFDLHLGEKIEFHCQLAGRGGPANPGQFDRTNYHRAQRKIVSCRIKHSEAITILNNSTDNTGLPFGTGVFRRLGRRLQLVAQESLVEDSYYENADNKTSQGFLMALLLGQRYKISAHITESFMRTGTAHFLALSGLHIGILTAFIWWLCRLFKLPRWLQGTLALCFVIVFLMIVPPRASAVRASIISIVFCIAYMTRRVTSAVNLLSLAALIILLWRPGDLFSAGFQLSFVVVLAIVLFVPMMYRRQFITDQDDPLIVLPEQNTRPQPLSRPQHIKRFIRRYIGAIFVVSLVAWIAGMPLAAYHFNRIAVWTAFASMPLFPLMGIILLGGLLKILLGTLLPVFATVLNYPLDMLSRAVIFLVEQFAAIPYSSINTASPPIWLIVVFYALLIWTGYSVRHNRAVPRLTVGGLLVWAIAFVWLLPFNKTTQTTIDMLAIGHGTASVVRLPDGKVICYDVGSQSNFNIAPTIAGPFLRSRGVNHIDALFISHANIDHYNGVIDICRNFNVATVYVTRNFTDKPARPVKMLLETLKKMDQPIKYLSQRHVLHNPEARGDDYYQIEVLWPSGATWAKELSANDSSLVLRISDQHSSILLCGDISEFAQRALIEANQDQLKADILQLPHHGSTANDTLPEFIKAVKPTICINSCGKMSAAEEKKLSAILTKPDVFHTYRSGAITVKLTDTGPEVQTFH